MNINDTPIHKCILQVEDEEADIFLLQFAFKKAGIQSPVQAVMDGQMAIDYLSGTGAYADREKHPLPCLVLLDLKLPKISGLEVLAWIRQQPNLRSLAVVVFSSSSQPSDLERAYELGANSFIQKAAQFEQTLEIAQLLKGWWLGYNRFAPIYEAKPAPTSRPA
jgi:CheY-like chemotaxis protein